MPLFLLGALLLLVLAFIALLPISLIQRYRMGTARQRARGWLTAINFAGIALSCVIFLVGAAVTSFWVPNAFTLSVAGMAAGCVLGLLGLVLTKWEETHRDLHFTPSRPLVLAITLLVTARLVYGFWRAWESWAGSEDIRQWVAVSGAARSLGVGAIVLGYYLVFWGGIRRRQKRHARRPLRPM